MTLLQLLAVLVLLAVIVRPPVTSGWDLLSALFALGVAVWLLWP